MKEYEDIEYNAFDVFNVSNTPDTTTTSKKQENDLNWQKIHQLERGIEEKLIRNSEILKATSRNTVKQLKIRQEIQATTWAGKIAKAAAKQLAKKKLQIKKIQIEEWKQTFITEVMQELQSIKYAYKKSMGIQK